jgi:hypothetical protein
MYDFDDIDRALFSLQLEEPPAELRASILAVTVDAPFEVVTARPFTYLDLGIVALVLGIAGWLAYAFTAGHLSTLALESTVRQFGSALAHPQVLAWLGAGASTAVWLSLANFSALPGARSRTA